MVRGIGSDCQVMFTQAAGSKNALTDDSFDDARVSRGGRTGCLSFEFMILKQNCNRVKGVWLKSDWDIRRQECSEK